MEIPQLNNLKIKKIPYLSTRPYLIDSFSILGYSRAFIEEKIIKPIKDKIKDKGDQLSDEEKISNNSFFNEFIVKERMTVLNTISNNHHTSEGKLNFTIERVFPSGTIVYFPKVDKNKYEPSQYSIILFFNNDKENKDNELDTLHIYNFVFYEFYYANEKDKEKKKKIFVPKIFSFSSEYSFFSTFKEIATNLLERFHSTNNEIPLELLMYNIVNFTPAPFASSIAYVFFPYKDIDIKYYARKKVKEKPLVLKQLSGYPYIDYNLGEIFKIFSVNFLIWVMLLAFLEQNIIFFSKNIEILNLFMYTIIVLSYPFNEIEYFWNVMSFSLEDFKSRKEPHLTKPFALFTGVNSSFTKENLNKEELNSIINDYHSLIIVDLDQKKIHRKFEEAKFIQLYNYIVKSVEKKSDQPSVFESSIAKLHDELKLICKKIYFKGNSDKLPNFFYVDQIIMTQNKKIQELFYNFLISICEPFYSAHSLYSEIDNYKHEPVKPRDIIKDAFQIVLNASAFKDLNEEEKQFYQYISGLMKGSIFFHNFFIEDRCKEIMRIPYLFAEEFLFLKSKMKNTINSFYFDIIDNFYKISTTIQIIDFSNFYKYFYNNNPKKYYLEETLYYSNNIAEEQNDGSIKYIYDKVELDQNLLMKYAYRLSCLSDFDFNNIFNNNIFLYRNTCSGPLVSTLEVTSSIENGFIPLKIICNRDMIIFSFFLAIGLTNHIYKNQMEYSLILNFFNELTFFTRRYIHIVLLIIRKLVKEKLNKLKEGGKEKIDEDIMCYYLIINYIRNHYILPNPQLIHLIKELHKIKQEIDEIEYIPDIHDEWFMGETASNEFKIEIDPVIEKEKDKLKRLEEIKNAIKTSSFSDVLYYYDGKKNEKEKVIVTLISNTLVKKVIIYTPLKLFEHANYFVNLLLENKHFDQKEEEFQQFLINIIFYLTFEGYSGQFLANNIFYCLKIQLNN